MADLHTRRHFLVRSGIVLAGISTGVLRPERLLAAQALTGQSGKPPLLRFGVITDIHYSERDHDGTRYYRDSLGKMRAAVQSLNETAKKDSLGLSFAATLGDMVDYAGDELNEKNIAEELGFLKTIEAEWAKVSAERHYVLGNHCVFSLTKEEFFANTKARPAPYSFDTPFKEGEGAVHFVVLDACFIADGTPYGRRNADWRDSNIPASQLQWLANDLAKTKNPVIILAHQRLDGFAEDGAGDFQVKNASQVRSILEKSGKVLAVLQGHSHQNFVSTVNDIPYCVLRAMVENPGVSNNAFSTIEIFADHSIVIHGNFQQTTYSTL